MHNSTGLSANKQWQMWIYYLRSSHLLLSMCPFSTAPLSLLQCVCVCVCMLVQTYLIYRSHQHRHHALGFRHLNVPSWAQTAKTQISLSPSLRVWPCQLHQWQPTILPTVYNSADQSRFPSKVTKKRLILKLHKSAQTFQSSVKNNTGVTLKASSSASHLTNWTPIPFSLPRGKKLSSPKLQAKLDGSGIFHFQSFIHSIQTLALCIPWMWPHVSHI